MVRQIRLASLLIALLTTAAGFAAAQALSLSQEQRLKVYRTLIKEAIPAQAAEDVAIVAGQDVPASVALYPMPVYVIDGTPEASAYRFTIWKNQVVLVERDSRKAVAIVRE